MAPLIDGAGLTFSSVSAARRHQGDAVPGDRGAHLQSRHADEIHRNSILTPPSAGTVMGLGWRSYTAALRALVEIVREEKPQALT